MAFYALSCMLRGGSMACPYFCYTFFIMRLKKDVLKKWFIQNNVGQIFRGALHFGSILCNMFWFSEILVYLNLILSFLREMSKTSESRQFYIRALTAIAEPGSLCYGQTCMEQLCAYRNVYASCWLWHWTCIFQRLHMWCGSAQCPNDGSTKTFLFVTLQISGSLIPPPPHTHIHEESACYFKYDLTALGYHNLCWDLVCLRQQGTLTSWVCLCLSLMTRKDSSEIHLLRPYSR